MNRTMNQQHDQSQRPIVPAEYGGKWIAWNHEATKIIAHGDDFADVRDQAEAQGEADPVYEKVPPSNARLVGSP